MTIYEILATILASIGIIISLFTLIFTKINANKIEKIYYGQSEISIRESITDATNRITDILLYAKTEDNQYTNQCMKVSIEQLLNSYEEACAKYLDSKVDKKRFKKMYIDEIRNIVESNDFKEYFQFGSNYDAIKKIYDEWFNLEN